MSSSQYLPFSRGPHQGEEWFVGQAESQEIRRQLIARRTGGLITTAQSEFLTTHDVVATGPNSNEAWGVPIQQQYDIRFVRKVRLNVTALDANMTYDVALYTQQLVGDRTTLRLIPPSKSTFSLAATGIVENTLTYDAKVPGGTLVWAVGNLSSGAGAPTLASHDLTNGIFQAYKWSVAGLPNELDIGDATSSAYFPLVGYLSPQLSEAF